ncbi:MAG: hypothetical protein QXO60_00600 [Candidatus Micrarchaeia archaeon]
MENMEKNCEDIRPKNMGKENRVWKAAKIGILGLSLMVFGRNIKAEDPMKTPFIKERYENGTVIEYEYHINDKNNSEIQKDNYFNSKDNVSNTDSNVSIYWKNEVVGRTFFQIEINREKNSIDSKYTGKSIYGDYTDYKDNDETKLTGGFFGIGTSIAPDGVNEKIKFGIGYYNEEIQKTGVMKYNSLHKDVSVVIGYDVNENPITIYGDMNNNEMLNEDMNGSYMGNKIYLQYIINQSITPIIWFIRAKGTINHSLDHIDEYTIQGNICYLGSCQPGAYYFGFETHKRNNDIKTSKTEIGVRLPITLGKNLVVGEYTKTTRKYDDTDASFNNFLEKEVIDTINFYYKREIIRNFAIKIGYTHTLQKIIRLYNEENRQDSKLVVGTQLKF